MKLSLFNSMLRLRNWTLVAIIYCSFSFFAGCDAPRQENGSSETEFVGETAQAEDSIQQGPETTDEEKDWGGLAVLESGEKVEEATHIIVFLHGLGGDANEMKFISKRIETPSTTCFVFPNGPLTARNDGKAWMLRQADFEDSRSKVLLLLKYLREQNEDAKIILGGYSQGAIISSNLISESPQLLSAVILLSPSGQIQYEPDAEAPEKPLIFHSHGRNDRVLPFRGSEALYEKLVSAAYNVDWFPYDGGHGISPNLPARLQKFVDRITTD